MISNTLNKRAELLIRIAAGETSLLTDYKDFINEFSTFKKEVNISYRGFHVMNEEINSIAIGEKICNHRHFSTNERVSQFYSTENIQDSSKQKMIIMKVENLLGIPIIDVADFVLSELKSELSKNTSKKLYNKLKNIYDTFIVSEYEIIPIIDSFLITNNYNKEEYIYLDVKNANCSNDIK